MEVYVLDTFYRREWVLEGYESFIWTERMRDEGDFELVIQSTIENRNLLPIGAYLAMNESHRVMTIESIEGFIDNEGRSMLTIKGPSIESVLKDRVARTTLNNLTTTPKWVITGTPTTVARKIFHDVCVSGLLSTYDIIPYINEGQFMFPVDTIAEPSGSITVELEPTSVYDAVKNICDLYDLGFRLVRNYDSSELWWDIYMGCDRTSSQSTHRPIIFSSYLDNLRNSREINSTTSYKNVAYVYSPVGTQVVYADGVDSTISGFERRAIVVKADDITDTDPTTANNKMIQRGKEVLSENRKIQAYDGELAEDSGYTYGVDYNIGDLVEEHTDSGAVVTMQVTEQIFVSDTQGDRSYPTLTMRSYVTPGSWVTFDYNRKWDEFGTTEYWNNQP